MATTRNYLSLANHLNIYNSDYSRVDASVYTTSWQALNATIRVTDIPTAIMDIDYYALEIMPTNLGKVTLYLNSISVPEFLMAREMIFHCQVKCATDVDTTTSLFETGQPMGLSIANTKKTTRDQFSTVRSNIWPLFRYEGDKTGTIELDFENHGGNIIYLTIPAVINHFDFYRNSVVRSSRTVIPDAYWRLDFEQSDPQFPMYKLLDTLTNTSNDVMQLFSNWFDHELDELAPGLTGTEPWTKSTLTDPTLADAGNMDWLAQFTGSGLKGNIAGTDQPAGTARDFYTTSTDINAFLQWQLENSYYGRGAGTREAMVSAVQRVLTGNKDVALIPHFGTHAWKIQVQTLRSETQDFDASTFSSDDVLDAVAQASPMGYEIFHMAVLFFAFTLGNVGLGRLGLGVLGGPGGYVPPDAPGSLSISAGGTPSTELTLTWPAPAYNGGDVVSAYLIRRNGSIIVANTGNTNLTYTDTGRSPGTAYSYTVAAINGAGAGDQSPSASGTTDPIVSNAPTSLTAAAGSTPSSMINLSWVAPVYTGGAAIVGYQITENRAGAGDVVIVSNTGSTATTYTRTGLDRVVSHTYSVKAINSAGVGAASNTAVLTTAAELPGPPTGLTLTAGSPAMTVISLSWTAPADTGGAAISGYQIKKNGSIVVADTGGTATTYSATGLTAGATYTFAVAAINSSGEGGDSNVPSLTTSGPIHATGGTITSYGNYIIHTFIADGTFTITENDRADTFDVLMVAGGGGGGASSTGSGFNAHSGGGGGGGDVREITDPGTIQGYDVNVGDGGTGNNSGNHTTFERVTTGGFTVDTASGGGDGAGGNATGSGGGGTAIYHNADMTNTGGNPAGTGNPNDGGDGEVGGNIGSSSPVSPVWASGGGGGGRGAVGEKAGTDGDYHGGDGGTGYANNYQTGSNQYYGAGGGGGSSAYAFSGGGGSGLPTSVRGEGVHGSSHGATANSWDDTQSGTAATTSTPNTGGGGGGGAGVSYQGGSALYSETAGASGIIIVRYLAS